MTDEYNHDETPPSLFRSYVVLAGACLGLAALWWLRENVWDPDGPGVRPETASGPDPARASNDAPRANGAPPASVAAEPEAAAGDAAEPEAANDDRPATAGAEASPEAAKPDDLTTIEGIGPKIAQVLGDAGVGSFARLAEKSADDIREILVAANPRYRMFDPETWPEQARLAAEDQLDELNALQGKLDGGRRS